MVLRCNWADNGQGYYPLNLVEKAEFQIDKQVRGEKNCIRIILDNPPQCIYQDIRVHQHPCAGPSFGAT